MQFDNFTLSIRNLDDFIYKSESSPSMNFARLSRLAHTAHSSITRRYRIFMRVKRSTDTNINKDRAKRCCNMVKKHVRDLKKVRAYLYKHEMDKDHPIFIQKIDGWIDTCERIHARYKHHINEL